MQTQTQETQVHEPISVDMNRRAMLRLGSLAGGVLLAGQVASVRAAAPQPRSYGVNVTDFGADSTGSADSTTAFLNAIAAVSAGGGTVFVPRGSYRIGQTLPLYDYVSLCGECRSTVLDFSSQAAGPALQIGATGNLSVADLQIKNPADTGVEVRSPSGSGTPRKFCHFRDVEVLRDAWQPASRGGIGFWVRNAHLATFERCSVQNTKNFGFCFDGRDGWLKAIKLDTCRADGVVGGPGFFLEGMMYSSMNNCWSSGNGTSGYSLVNSQCIAINACGAEDNYLSSVSISETDAWARDWNVGAQGMVTGITISSFCTIRGNTHGDPLWGDYMTLYTENGRVIEGSSVNHVAIESAGKVVKRGDDYSAKINFPIWQGSKQVG